LTKQQFGNFLLDQSFQEQPTEWLQPAMETAEPNCDTCLIFHNAIKPKEIKVNQLT
jgi:hypothetical protein